jgi:hypothetical protein
LPQIQISLVSYMKVIKITKEKTVLVDDDVFEYLNSFKWHFDGSYAARKEQQPDGTVKTVKMHREIMNPPKDKSIDHINSDGLDNRRENLRIATHAQNIMNQRPRKNTSSQYKGVSWCKRYKKYEAYINCNGKRTRLGSFRNENDAAMAYNVASERLHGEFARKNVIVGACK